MNELERKLRQIYKPTKPDVFGRRPATPKQIKDIIDGDFEALEPYYQPKEEDIERKNDIPYCQYVSRTDFVGFEEER